MIEIEHIEEWRGQQVVDSSGESLGKLDEVYYDVAGGQPLLIAVKSGLLGRKSFLIPLQGATAGRDQLHVAHERATVEASGEIAADGPPTPEQLAELGSGYGLRFAPDTQLQSAGEIEARRAEAEAARERAEAAAQEEQARRTDRDAAAERARQAVADAKAADQAAHEAGRAADDARREADRY